MVKKRTRRERFLAEMEKVVRWVPFIGQFWPLSSLIPVAPL
jgi:hypothetical protein